MSVPGDAAETVARRLCERLPALAALAKIDRLRLAEELQDAIDDGVAAELEDADKGWGDADDSVDYPFPDAAEVA